MLTESTRPETNGRKIPWSCDTHPRSPAEWLSQENDSNPLLGSKRLDQEPLCHIGHSLTSKDNS